MIDRVDGDPEDSPCFVTGKVIADKCEDNRLATGVKKIGRLLVCGHCGLNFFFMIDVDLH